MLQKWVSVGTTQQLRRKSSYEDIKVKKLLKELCDIELNEDVTKVSKYIESKKRPMKVSIKLRKTRKRYSKTYRN